MKIFLIAVLTCVAASIHGCASQAGRAEAPVIDFEEMSVAGIRPGDGEETVLRMLGHPYEIDYGRADGTKEIWPYYDRGLKVVIDKRSREVDEVIVFFNSTRAYRPFRGKVAQGFPLAVRLADAKPKLDGYRESTSVYRGYREARVYSDDVETAKVREELVTLEKADDVSMTVNFDCDSWMESAVLTRKEAGESSERQRPAGADFTPEASPPAAAAPTETPGPGE